MQAIKKNDRQVKLLCWCKREFWASSKEFGRCPSCKAEWDGTILRYEVLRLQESRTSDYVTVVAGVCVTPGHFLEECLKVGKVLLCLSTGIKVEEITREEYNEIDQDKLTVV